MKITIDNIKKDNYECFDYPNKEIKRINISNIKYNNLGKNINIEFDDDSEKEDFICELIRENLSGEDLFWLLGESFFDKVIDKED